ncbi:MAG: 4-hydroxy-tetrahydrodipicolinate reductase [Syntrophomonadaceae bacterium]|nr:4-hydroxy-tetrahydrodipicolinate reductase [Syntrophomonadaceae bacterium]MDD3023359.1 4-hydroxy-tetrahydrodipicolinate reductase [Syntrophomonadaceae bacterium]
MSDKHRVIVSGALGKMGRETIKAIAGDNELNLVGAVDIKAQGESVAELTGLKDCGIQLENDLEAAIDRLKPDVMVDFTNPQAVFNNTKTALRQGVTTVVGTTGLNEIELKQLAKLAKENEVGVAVIPNFAIGAVLMMKFAREAALYFPDVEIIELHHDQKMDAPSGTAIKTAEMINQNRSLRPPRNIREFEKVTGARGGDVEQVRIHSVRLPGLIAHQEVIFGGVGQGLKIRHDSFDRIGFMPGVVMVIKKMIHRKELVYGMENLL